MKDPIPRGRRIFFEGGTRVRFDRDALRSVQPRDLAVRFAFGFGVSVAAGIVTLAFGSRTGGLFLAFPAILPASLTLIENKEGRRQAEGNAVGAIIGAVALVAFALTAWALFTHIPGAAVEGIALAAWLIVSILLYLLVRRLFR
jgi:Protein of unknown function (DUF3147)